MKKITFLAALLIVASVVNAQTKMQQGLITFNITYPELSAEMKQMAAMLPKTIKMYFKHANARTEMSMAAGNMITISDNQKNEMTMLMDMMGKKIAITQKEKDIEEKQAELKQKGMLPEYKLILSKETKQIAGYTCKKATVASTLNGKTENLVCYYTEDLPKITGTTDIAAFRDINGFLMEYNINQGGLKMRVTAAHVKPENVDDSMFIIPSDYEVMSQEDLSKMMQGFGEKQ